MARAERLLLLLEELRRHRRPVTGRDLAQRLNISLRTLYRDIDSLRAEGAVIEGEAGLGYVLRPGFTLPPLMFQAEEIEALLLGARWVAGATDAAMAAAAARAMARIEAVLPPELAESVQAGNLLVASRTAVDDSAYAVTAKDVRACLRAGCKVRIAYVDADGRSTGRVIWPIALGYLEGCRVLAAWCETRQDFRHFRLDRMQAWQVLEDRVPRRGAVLLAEWRRKEGIPLPPF